MQQLFELAGDLDMDMNNIQELQLLIGSRFECCIDLFAAVNLLKLNPLPLLDRLFIRVIIKIKLQFFGWLYLLETALITTLLKNCSSY
jgi:hypothetical protein